jgi:hypothetical protein
MIVNIFACLKIFFVEAKCELRKNVTPLRIFSVRILKTTNCRPSLQEPTVSTFSTPYNKTKWHRCITTLKVCNRIGECVFCNCTDFQTVSFLLQETVTWCETRLREFIWLLATNGNVYMQYLDWDKDINASSKCFYTVFGLKDWHKC